MLEQTGHLESRQTPLLIAVGVKLTASDRMLLTAVLALGERLQAELELVHVCESPWRENLTRILEDTALSARLGEIQAEALAAAGERLTALASSLPSKSPVRTHLASGGAAEQIARAAKEAGAALIACRLGQEPETAPATALGLASDAPLPLLLVPDDPKLDLRREKLKLLLCDDLTAASMPVLRFAFALATRLGACQLHHLHVQAVAVDGTDTALTALRAFLKNPKHMALGYEELITELTERLEQRLDERSREALPAFLAQGVDYTRELASGYPFTEIAEVSKRFEPDLVIFGKHVGVHRKPFYLGQIPSPRMLSLGQAMIVVPIVRS